VELAYALYLSAEIGLQEGSPEAQRGEVAGILTPFATAGLLSERGIALLGWAREP
jgi:hypothetical protein